jgi:LysM domain-containing protein
MNGASKVGVDQDPLLDLVNTRDYTIAYGDSPASVAKKFGISLSDLLAANPQKPTTITAGVRTFRELHIGEKLNVPTVGLSGADAIGVGFNFFKAALLPWGAPAEIAESLIAKSLRHRHPHRRTIQEWYRETHPGQPLPPYFSVGDIAAYHRAVGVGDGTAGVGDAANDAVQALAMVDACDPANVGLVWAAQQALGLDPDGKWGNASMKAAQARGILHAPYGCSPRPSWWAPVGQKNYPPGVSPMPAPMPSPMPGPAPAPAPMPMPAPMPAPMPSPMPGPAPAPAPMPMPAPMPGPGGAPGGPGGPGGGGGSGGGGGGVTPGGHLEKHHGISTGMIVAGAVGVAALVGIVAIAATSGKKTTTRYRTKKGKTRYITRKAPKRRKHNRSAHKKR